MVFMVHFSLQKIFLTHIRSRCVLGCFQSACWQYLLPGGLLLLQLQLFGKLFHKSYNSNIFYCLRSTFIQNQISKGLVRTLIPCVTKLSAKAYRWPKAYRKHTEGRRLPEVYTRQDLIRAPHALGSSHRPRRPKLTEMKIFNSLQIFHQFALHLHLFALSVLIHL